MTERAIVGYQGKLCWMGWGESGPQFTPLTQAELDAREKVTFLLMRGDVVLKRVDAPGWPQAEAEFDGFMPDWRDRGVTPFVQVGP